MAKNADKFDEIAKEYDDNLEELLGVWGKDIDRFAEYKIQQLRRLIPGDPHKILDFGCGTGHSLEYFKKYFPNSKLYGCDVSQESLQLAAETLPEAELFCNLPIETFTSREDNWDLVFLACVMHHIEPEDRAEWIKAISDKISINGYLAIFEHNILNPCTKKIILDPNNYVDNIDFMLSQQQLVNLLLENCLKFKLYWKGYTLFSPIRTNWILAVECALKWLPLGAQQCVIIKRER